MVRAECRGNGTEHLPGALAELTQRASLQSGSGMPRGAGRPGTATRMPGVAPSMAGCWCAHPGWAFKLRPRARAAVPTSKMRRASYPGRAQAGPNPGPEGPGSGLWGWGPPAEGPRADPGDSDSESALRQAARD